MFFLRVRQEKDQKKTDIYRIQRLISSLTSSNQTCFAEKSTIYRSFSHSNHLLVERCPNHIYLMTPEANSSIYPISIPLMSRSYPLISVNITLLLLLYWLLLNCRPFIVGWFNHVISINFHWYLLYNFHQFPLISINIHYYLISMNIHIH
jgi:hypothetical protein